MWLAVAVAVSLMPAQQPATPPRPRLPRGADTADAEAYRRYGDEWLRREPGRAAAAFFWAARIDPETAENPYALYVASVLGEPALLRAYMGVSRRREPRLVSLDSLMDRARRLNPYVQRYLDDQLIVEFVVREVATSLRLEGSEANRYDLALEYEVTTYLERQHELRPVLDQARGRLPAALRGWARLIRENPRDAWLHSERGRTFFIAGRFDSALAEMRTALAIQRRGDADTLRFYYETKAAWEFAIGRAFEAMSRPDSARAAYERALVEELSYYPAHLRLGALHLARSDTAAALREMARAVAVKDDEYVSRIRYGEALQAAGMHDSAEVHLRRAIELEPWAARPRLFHSVVLDALGRRPEALDGFAAFLQRASRSDQYRPGVEQLLAQWRTAR